jgi:hypothetical protein
MWRARPTSPSFTNATASHAAWPRGRVAAEHAGQGTHHNHHRDQVLDHAAVATISAGLSL